MITSALETKVHYELRWTSGSGRPNKARFDTVMGARDYVDRAFKNGRVFTLVKVTVTEEVLPIAWPV